MKEKEILACATARMNLEDVMLEVGQSQKDKCCNIPLVWEYLGWLGSWRQILLLGAVGRRKLGVGI